MPERRVPVNPQQGERLRELMRENSLSQAKLAEIAGCSQQAISKYILCDRSLPYSVAAKLADVFNTRVEYLLCAADARDEAKWVSNFRHDDCIVCSSCGLGIPEFPYWIDCNRENEERESCVSVDAIANYCPQCGAKMKGWYHA